jgi:hypothetical protein
LHFSDVTFKSMPPKESLQPDIVHNDIAGAEKRLRELKRSFGSVAWRWERPARMRKLYRAVTFALVLAIGTFAVVWYLVSSPWPLVVALKHLAAFPNCDAAEAIGLAPARRGRPGYWGHNDVDGDGVACEQPKWRVRHMIVPMPL